MKIKRFWGFVIILCVALLLTACDFSNLPEPESISLTAFLEQKMSEDGGKYLVKDPDYTLEEFIEKSTLFDDDKPFYLMENLPYNYDRTTLENSKEMIMKTLGLSPENLDFVFFIQEFSDETIRAMSNGWGHLFKGVIKIAPDVIESSTRDELYSTYVHEMVHIARDRMLLPYDEVANDRRWPSELGGGTDVAANEGETILITAYILRDNLPKYEGKTLVEIAGQFYTEEGDPYLGYAGDSFDLLGEEGIEDMINTIKEHANEEL